jgi:hypothetical protein
MQRSRSHRAGRHAGRILGRPADFARSFPQRSSILPARQPVGLALRQVAAHREVGLRQEGLRRHEHALDVEQAAQYLGDVRRDLLVHAGDLDVDRQVGAVDDGFEAGRDQAALGELAKHTGRDAHLRGGEHREAPDGILGSIRREHDARSPSGTRKSERARPGSRREPGG